MATACKRYSWLIIACLVLVLPQDGGLPVAVAADSGDKVLKTQKGKASYYGTRRHGRRTASGVKFDRNAMMAAHPSWPFGTLVRVTNLKNGRSVNVRVTDRGPSKKMQRRGLVIDVSVAAAKALDFVKAGKASVRLDVLEWGERQARR